MSSFGLASAKLMRRQSIPVVSRSCRTVCSTMMRFSSSTPASDSSSSSTLNAATASVAQAKFYVPRAERGDRPLYDIDKMVGETRLYRDSRICPTRELYFGNEQWGRHKSTNRKLRHMLNLFRAAPFQRLFFPDFFGISVIAGCLTYYNEVVVSADPAAAMISLSPTAFAGTTTAIGLLAGFRLNNSYGRYKEGRGYWSKVNTATRGLTRQTLTFMSTPNPPNPNDNKQPENSGISTDQLRMLRLCQAFPISLNFHLSDKGSHHSMKRRSKPGEAPFKARVNAEFRAELWDVYERQQGSSQGNNDGSKDILKRDFERICRVKSQGGNVPLEIVTCMGETIASFDRNGFKPIYVRELDNQVHVLTEALGSCERIVKTPLPTGFSRHSSRLLFMWSNSLPFALYPLMGPVATLPTALLTAYAVLGIEDISVQLEEPFDILPLRQYSDTMFESIRAIEASYQLPSTNKS